jgi:DnaJ-class molecular chaperone
MTISIIWNDDNNNDYGEVCDHCVGCGIVEVAENEENGDEHFWEMECEFCFGTGYEGGMN